MKQIKVSEATPIQLGWLVATCEGYTNLRRNPHRFAQQLIMNRGGTIKNLGELNYSTDWAQGGALIERECIATYASGACSVPPKNPDYWVAEILATDGMFTQFGHTPLIAAMRCFAASKLGETVEVPEELG